MEQRSTEETLQPIYDQIREAEEQIKDQKSKIQAAKAKIIRNTATIQNLLFSVVK